VTGLAQALNAPDSSLHWNVTPLWLSVKADVAFVWLVGFAGVLVIDGAGGGVCMMVKALVAELLRPWVSVDTACTVYCPSAVKFEAGNETVQLAVPLFTGKSFSVALVNPLVAGSQ
jgi:hypothetical protein